MDRTHYSTYIIIFVAPLTHIACTIFLFLIRACVYLLHLLHALHLIDAWHVSHTLYVLHHVTAVHVNNMYNMYNIFDMYLVLTCTSFPQQHDSGAWEEGTVDFSQAALQSGEAAVATAVAQDTVLLVWRPKNESAGQKHLSKRLKRPRYQLPGLHASQLDLDKGWQRMAKNGRLQVDLSWSKLI